MDQTNWAEIPCKDRMCRTCDMSVTQIVLFMFICAVYFVRYDRHGNCYFIKGIKYEISEYGQAL